MKPVLAFMNLNHIEKVLQMHAISQHQPLAQTFTVKNIGNIGKYIGTWITIQRILHQLHRRHCSFCVPNHM